MFEYDDGIGLGESQNMDRVILTGEGRAFEASADAKEFGKTPTEPHLPVILHRIENFPIPVISAMNAAALGGGLEIALSCHYRSCGPESPTGPGRGKFWDYP